MVLRLLDQLFSASVHFPWHLELPNVPSKSVFCSQITRGTIVLSESLVLPNLFGLTSKIAVSVLRVIDCSRLWILVV